MLLVEMKVRAITLDPTTNMPVIILRDLENKKSLPIWIGIFEANAIASEMEKNVPSRPMTRDLIKNLIEGLKSKVTRIIVNDLRNNTFFAIIELEKNGVNISVDSRPSDAIALALRVNAPILVSEEVIKKAKTIDMIQIAEGKEILEDKEKLREWLDKLKPEDFGKYEM
ncbi:MAG: bifunctional nuclease family protein [bacterium]